VNSPQVVKQKLFFKIHFLNNPPSFFAIDKPFQKTASAPANTSVSKRSIA
jgi:hypothetical protein